MSHEHRVYITEVTAPTEEPVTLQEFKLHQRIDHSDEDLYINNLLASARKLIERLTGRQMVTATYDLTLDTFPSTICLPRPPAASVTSITYIDNNGDSTTLAASLYTVDVGNEDIEGVIIPAINTSWPATYGHIGDVVVRFVTGYGARGAVPESMKQQVHLLVSHWYEHREAVGENMSEIPLGFTMLNHANRIPII